MHQCKHLLLGLAIGASAMFLPTAAAQEQFFPVDSVTITGGPKPAGRQPARSMQGSEGTATFNPDSSATTNIPARLNFTWRSPLERATYLGVAGSPVMPALREQLNLKRGTGILVERVETDSPAEVAGVKQYDVLEKLDDQILINGQQLAVLVRLHKPDDEIKLTVIRQGQRQTLTSRLVEKEVPVLDEKSLWGMPGSTSDDKLIGNIGTVTLFSKSSPKVVENLPEALMTGSKVPAIATVSDDQHNYLIKTDADGTLRVLMMTKKNETLFDGDADSAQGSKTIPTYIKDLITKIKAGKPSTTQP